MERTLVSLSVVNTVTITFMVLVGLVLLAIGKVAFTSWLGQGKTANNDGAY